MTKLVRDFQHHPVGIGMRGDWIYPEVLTDGILRAMIKNKEESVIFQ